jgi:acyl carrier protein
MTTPSELMRRVREIIVQQLGVSSAEVTAQASLADDLYADSLDCVELLMAIEEEYDLEIPDEDANQIQAVGDLISYLENRLSKS